MNCQTMILSVSTEVRPNEYLIGHFKSSTYGKCELYVYADSYPIIMIKTRDEVIFMNTRDSDDTYSIFESIHS